MLCVNHPGADDLEERRVRGGEVARAFVSNPDTVSALWGLCPDARHTAPARRFLYHLHTTKTPVPAPVRRFVFAGVMLEHTPEFFVAQLRSLDGFATSRFLSQSGAVLHQPTSNMYIDLLITALVFCIEKTDADTDAAAAGYALVDELLGYAVTGAKLRPLTAMRMPDVSVLMPLVALDARSKADILRKYPGADDETISIVSDILDILFKLMPFRCVNREFYSMLRNKCRTASPLVCEFIAKVLAAAWLGVYPSSTQKAPLDVRVAVYRLLHRGFTRQTLASFFTPETSVVSMYMFKEYFCYVCENNIPSFYTALSKYNWDAYGVYVRRVTNTDVRGSVSLPFALFFGRPGPTTVSAADAKHDEYRRYQSCSTVDYDLDQILDVFDNVCFSVYPHSRCIYGPGNEHLMGDPRLLLPPNRLGLMRSCISVIRSPRPDFAWLACFGADADAVREMRRAVFLKRPNMERFLLALFRRDPVSFCVIHSFFYLFYQHAGFTVFPGDTHMIIAQTRALADHFGLKDKERLPDCAGCVYACDNCGDVKMQTFYKRPPRAAYSTSAAVAAAAAAAASEAAASSAKKRGGGGHRSAMLNKPPRTKSQSSGYGKTRMMMDGTVVCARERRRPVWLDVHVFEHGFAPEAANLSKQRGALTIGKPEALHRKNVKHIATQKMISRCISTPQRHINAIGCIPVFRGIAYVGCYGCMRIIQLQKAECVGRDLLCSMCVTHVRSKIKWHEDACALCGQTKKWRMRQFCLYDDLAEAEGEGGVGALRDVNICASHNPMQWVIPGQVVFLSRLLYEIHLGCGARTSRDGMVPISGRGRIPKRIIDLHFKPREPTATKTTAAGKSEKRHGATDYKGAANGQDEEEDDEEEDEDEDDDEDDTDEEEE